MAFSGLFRRFLADRGGNFGMMVVVITLPVLLVGVKAMDYSLASKARADLQALADSVALAAVRGLEISEAEGLSTGEAVYTSGLALIGGGILANDLDLDLSAGSMLHAHSGITVTFKGILGDSYVISPHEVFVSSDAISQQQPIEVAFATDLSPSMDAAEVKALVKSVRALTTSVYAEDSVRTPVRMAYTPFTRNVPLPAYASAWISGAGTATPGRVCVGPRSTATDATDATPDASIFPPFKVTQDYCPPEVMQPLTKDKTLIEALITKAEARKGPYRGTGVYEGFAWMYRALSPKWQPYWPEGSKPADANAARKVAILMTDGANDASVGYTKTVADQITKDVCANMKKDGIEIYVVTFKLTADLVALYQGCASTPAHHIDSATDAEMEAAFKALAGKVSSRQPQLVF